MRDGNCIGGRRAQRRTDVSTPPHDPNTGTAPVDRRELKPNLSHARLCAPRMRYTRRSTPRPRTGKERDAVDGLVGSYQPKCVMQRATSACAAAMPGANSRSLTCHHRLPTAIARLRQIVSDSDASMSRLPSKESQPHRIFVVLRCCLMIFEIIPGFFSFVSNILQGVE